MVSSLVLFSVSLFNTGPYEKTLNTVGLFWGCMFIAVEPLRVGVFFDQLPTKMTPHQSAHVFLVYQEMKTVGSIVYVVLSKLLASKVYGETPLSLAILYFTIPLLYIIVILGFWKIANPGEFSYSIGIDCVTCYLRAFHLKFVKRVKQEGHWLDVSRYAYDAKTVRSAKITASLIFLFTTLMSYGMAQVLITNSWGYQSQSLIEDLYVKKFYQDVSMVFFVLTIVLLPFIEYLLLPQIYKRRKNQKPFTELQRIGITMFLTGMAFALTTIVQLEIETNASIIPSGTRSQVRILNVRDENFIVSGNWVFEPTNISEHSMLQAWNLRSRRTTLYTVTITESKPVSNRSEFTSFIATVQGESITYLIGEHELLRVKGFDPIVFGPPGTNQNDMVRVYVINYKVSDERGGFVNVMHPGYELWFKNLNDTPSNDRNIELPEPFDRSVFQLFPGVYHLECPPVNLNAFEAACIEAQVTIKRAGIYAILPYVMKRVTLQPPLPPVVEYEQHFKIYTVNNPAVYSVYLMLPQIIIQAFAVAMGKIPINVFMFNESPRETRVITLALYYFSQDGSSIIFAMFHEVFQFRVDSFQLVLVTGIHMVFCFFFTFAALKHQKFPEHDGVRRRRALIGSG